MYPKALIENTQDIPDIFMACGVNDFLYDKNVDFYEFLKSKNVDVNFIQAPGEHTWDFCDKYLKEFLKTVI